MIGSFGPARKGTQRDIALSFLIMNGEMFRVQACSLSFEGDDISISTKFFNRACTFFNTEVRAVLHLDKEDVVVDLIKIVDDGMVIYEEEINFETADGYVV